MLRTTLVIGYVPVVIGIPNIFMLISVVGIVAREPDETVIRLVSAAIVRTRVSTQSTDVQLGNLGLQRFEISVVG
jgi:hypothetical protein